jgi:hypothetical protein
MKRNVLSTKASIALMLVLAMLIPLTGYASDLDEEKLEATI